MESCVFLAFQYYKKNKGGGGGPGAGMLHLLGIL